MKHFIIYSFSFILLMVLITGCKKDKIINLDQTKYNKKVNEVTSLLSPQNNEFVNFKDKTTPLVFEWAKEEDNGAVWYKVLFDKIDGDFSNPIYEMSSEQGGLNQKLSISPEVMSQIAQLAGIPAYSKGKIKWAIRSAKGLAVKRSTVVHILEIERPYGFSYIPETLFMTGNATEGNTDLTRAVNFKRLDKGVFEVYTSLKAGSYNFGEKGEKAITYSINSDHKLVEGGTNAITGATKVYRIVVDFNKYAVKFTEISSLGLWFAPENRILFDLPYVGNGHWEIKNAAIVFKQEGWGRDERYKFRLQVKNGDAESTEEFGSSKIDNNRPDNNTPLSFWELKPIANINQWDYCFKFNGAVDNNKADVNVSFNAGAAYTHTVTVK